MKNYRKLSATDRCIPLKDGDAFTLAYKDENGQFPIHSGFPYIYQKEFMAPLFKKESGASGFDDCKFYIVTRGNEPCGIIKRASYDSTLYHVLAIDFLTRGNEWSEKRSAQEMIAFWSKEGKAIYECDTIEATFVLIQDLKSNTKPK